MELKPVPSQKKRKRADLKDLDNSDKQYDGIGKRNETTETKTNEQPDYESDSGGSDFGKCCICKMPLPWNDRQLCGKTKCDNM